MTQQLFDHMEDFDNWESEDRKEQLMDAVALYNEEHGTNFNTLAEYFNYERQRKQQDQ